MAQLYFGEENKVRGGMKKMAVIIRWRKQHLASEVPEIIKPASPWSCKTAEVAQPQFKLTSKQETPWNYWTLYSLGGERSQRGKEKDGCDHPLTEAISYRHITWLLVGDFLRLKSGDDKKWCQSSPASQSLGLAALMFCSHRLEIVISYMKIPN